eukprot:RCo005159
MELAQLSNISSPHASSMRQIRDPAREKKELRVQQALAEAREKRKRNNHKYFDPTVLRRLAETMDEGEIARIVKILLWGFRQQRVSGAYFQMKTRFFFQTVRKIQRFVRACLKRQNRVLAGLLETWQQSEKAAFLTRRSQLRRVAASRELIEPLSLEAIWDDYIHVMIPRQLKQRCLLSYYHDCRKKFGADYRRWHRYTKKATSKLEQQKQELRHLREANRGGASASGSGSTVGLNSSVENILVELIAVTALDITQPPSCVIDFQEKELRALARGCGRETWLKCIRAERTDLFTQLTRMFKVAPAVFFKSALLKFKAEVDEAVEGLSSPASLTFMCESPSDLASSVLSDSRVKVSFQILEGPSPSGSLPASPASQQGMGSPGGKRLHVATRTTQASPEVAEVTIDDLTWADSCGEFLTGSGRSFFRPRPTGKSSPETTPLPAPGQPPAAVPLDFPLVPHVGEVPPSEDPAAALKPSIGGQQRGGSPQLAEVAPPCDSSCA